MNLVPSTTTQVPWLPSFPSPLHFPPAQPDPVYIPPAPMPGGRWVWIRSGWASTWASRSA